MNAQNYNPPADFSQAGGFLNFFDFFIYVFLVNLPEYITAIAVMFFFYAIILYIWKKRDGKAEEGDRKRISWAIILLTIMFSVYAIINIARLTFGLNENNSNNTVPSRTINF